MRNVEMKMHFFGPKFERLLQKGIRIYIRIFRIQENIQIRIRVFSNCNRLFELIRIFQKKTFEYFKIAGKKSRKKYIFVSKNLKKISTFHNQFFLSKELIVVTIILKLNP
jgi:hypothetical protein